MKRLFEIDVKDYETGYKVYRRPSARGIILQGDKIALVYSEQENFYYICDVENANIGQELDEYEREAGFVLKILPIDEAIRANGEYHSENYFNEVMIKRELRVLQMVKAQI